MFLLCKPGNTIAEIDTSSIREFFCVCVTIDDINEFATRAEKLRFIDVDPGVIAISLDDLLVYEHYFDNPLIFLHFLMQRRRASEHQRIAFNDELDHLGMYIDNNCYSVTIDILFKQHEHKHGAVHHTMYDGFRDDLNEWFEAQYEGKNAQKPVQASDKAFDQLITALSKSNNPNRRFISCSLLDLGSEDRKAVTDAIADRISYTTPPNCILGLPGSSDKGETIVCLFACTIDRPNDKQIMKSKVIATLLTQQKSDAVAINVIYNCLMNIVNIEFFYIKESELTEEERRKADSYTELMAHVQRLSYRTKYGHKPGRNDPCPCGSGKKYKKCCLDKGIYE